MDQTWKFLKSQKNYFIKMIYKKMFGKIIRNDKLKNIYWKFHRDRSKEVIERCKKAIDFKKYFLKKLKIIWIKIITLIKYNWKVSVSPYRLYCVELRPINSRTVFSEIIAESPRGSVGEKGRRHGGDRSGSGTAWLSSEIQQATD